MFEALLEGRGFIITSFILVYILYFTGTIIYRLYFSPLAKFPGPRLAAATYLYEGYYDIVKRGKYTFKIRDLHAQYGKSRSDNFQTHILKRC